MSRVVADRERAVRRAHAVAHGWEHASALRETQRAAIAELARRARARRGTRRRRDGDDARDGTRGARRDERRRAESEGEDAMKRLTTAHAFYAWYADAEETMDEARRTARRRDADALRAEIRRRDDALGKLDEVERGVETLADAQAGLQGEGEADAGGERAVDRGEGSSAGVRGRAAGKAGLFRPVGGGGGAVSGWGHHLGRERCERGELGAARAE